MAAEAKPKKVDYSKVGTRPLPYAWPQLNDVPSWFIETVRQYKKGVEDLDVFKEDNPTRIQADWLYFQVVLKAADIVEVFEVIDEIDKLEAIYKQPASEARTKAIKTAMKSVQKASEDTNLESSERDAVHAVKDETEPSKTLPSLHMARSKLVHRCLVNNHMFYELRKYFIAPMEQLGASFETLPIEILAAPALQSAVYHARMKPPVTAVTETAKRLLQAKEEECKEVKKEEPVKKQKKCNAIKAFFSSLGKKARREELNMFEDDAYDEYGYVDRGDLNAYDVDVQPLQNQALHPFYHPMANQYQPVVIGGYDAGNAMSMDANMAFIGLFGVGMLFLVLCLLFVIGFGVAAAFGVYISNKRSTKLCHGNDGGVRDLV
mmetsp:Transcript_37744/g.60472  ORF Transcript_37744/g.60472 Transcript_37744/m.60472 type:complete len:377 (-) Transcript_37744:228-1358(-)